MPQVFGFPTVTDGIGMGTEGMKYSLVSREVIADCHRNGGQRPAHGRCCCRGWLRQEHAGKRDGHGAHERAGIFVYGGTIKPGFWKGEKLTIVSPFEAVGAFTAGKMSQEDFDGIEKNACPSFGACGGQYTANTMSSSFEALGMSLLGSSQMAAPDGEKADSAAESAAIWSRRCATISSRVTSSRGKRSRMRWRWSWRPAARPMQCFIILPSPARQVCAGPSTILSACGARCRCYAISNLQARMWRLISIRSAACLRS